MAVNRQGQGLTGILAGRCGKLETMEETLPWGIHPAEGIVLWCCQIIGDWLQVRGTRKVTKRATARPEGP
jgi:hypothetical protein